MTAPTTPVFIRDGLFTRCVCPGDGTAMHVTSQGLWECEARLHQWHRPSDGTHKPGQWKLLKEWKVK